MPNGSSRGLRLLAIGGVVAAAVVAAYWYVAIRPRLARIDGTAPTVEQERAKRLKPRVDAVADFDRSFALPIDPLGLAAHGAELLAGDRRGGVLRVRPLPDGDAESVLVKIREPEYFQLVATKAIASDRKNVVSYTSASWFQGPGDVFVLHDPRSLRLVRHVPAPPLLGCLAWDGASWWAATRKNTKESAEEAFLYRLDPTFAVVGRYAAPGPGCQGMAWDGERLWTADVFTGRITMLDVSGGEPATVSTNPTRFHYLSGLAVMGGDVFITEYGEKTLRRLNPRVRSAWLAEARTLRVEM